MPFVIHAMSHSAWAIHARQETDLSGTSHTPSQVVLGWGLQYSPDRQCMLNFREHEQLSMSTAGLWFTFKIMPDASLLFATRSGSISAQSSAHTLCLCRVESNKVTLVGFTHQHPKPRPKTQTGLAEHKTEEKRPEKVSEGRNRPN